MFFDDMRSGERGACHLRFEAHSGYRGRIRVWYIL